MNPAPASCPEKEQQIEEIRLAMNHVVALNNREMQAVITGDFAALPKVKSELVAARKRKDTLLEEYYDHLREHAC
jgi:malonyl CoA-acyl carrier protein transacylase